MHTEGEQAWATEHVYDRLAWAYDLLFEPFCLAGRKRALKRLDCRPGERVLEIGVGTGTSWRLYPSGVTVVGVDLSRGMLRKAARRLRRMGRERIHVARMDAQNLGFADESFDKVIAFYLMSVLPHPERCVEEMKRVCRPGGDLLFLNHFHNRNPVLRKVERALDPVTRRLGWKTTLDLGELVEATRLQVSEVEPVNLFGYWRLVHARRGGGARGAAAESN